MVASGRRWLSRQDSLKIFISYRRDDTSATTGRLYETLRTRYGESRIFMDVDDIPVGQDFRHVVAQTIDASGVMLVMIGPRWLPADPAARSRLDDPRDFVRIEVEQALVGNIAVVPVLVEGAQMPDADRLPSALRELAFRNAASLEHRSWDRDCGPLFETIDQNLDRARRAAATEVSVVADRPPPEADIEVGPPRRPDGPDGPGSVPGGRGRGALAAGAGLAVVGAVAVAGVLVSGGGGTRSSTTTDLPPDNPSVSLATVARPDDVEFSTSGSAVVLSWTHPGGESITFEISDADSGDELATGLVDTSYRFPPGQEPAAGTCVIVTAIEEVSSGLNPANFSDETCR